MWQRRFKPRGAALLTASDPLIVPVILAGGSGSRLWPVSRAAFPKHLVDLVGDESLLQATARRVLRCAPPERVVTVAAAAQAVLVRRHLQTCAPGLLSHLILEPMGRNTAAAIGIAAIHASRQWGGAALLWVCPSDHLVLDDANLLQAVAAGTGAAEAGRLVTFGITPTRPETGFGWIEAGAALPGHGDVFAVRRFVEKPDLDVAQAMLAAGGRYWNSGMFLMRAQAVVDELERFEPRLLDGLRRATDAMETGDGDIIPSALFEALPSLPIDKAVMERSDRVVVVPCDPGWSDVGSWQAIWEKMPHDPQENAVQGDVLLQGASGNLVKAEHRLVALAGVRDLAVIETPDAVLVTDRTDAGATRELVAAMVRLGRREASVHAREVRPWGQFTVLHQGPGFKVKEVVVDPGRSLTSQFHTRRDETWVIVSGTASVELDGQPLEVPAGGSLRVRSGVRHRLTNQGKDMLKLIEIGWGEGLGDDDTVRLDAASTP